MEQNHTVIRWDEIKLELEKVWREIPKPFRNGHAVQRTLQCSLYGLLRTAGYQVVADYMPPRVADRSVDLIALNPDLQIVHAVCFDALVSLAAVKSLASFDAQSKIILTTSPMEKKVQESRFFLKPEIEHIHLQPF